MKTRTYVICLIWVAIAAIVIGCGGSNNDTGNPASTFDSSANTGAFVTTTGGSTGSTASTAGGPGTDASTTGSWTGNTTSTASTASTAGTTNGGSSGTGG